MRLRFIYACLCVLGLTSSLFSAPVPKEPEKGKEENEGEPTKEEVRRSQNNLKQIALAMHNYESANGTFPSDIRDKDGKPILSWRVAILPYLEEDQLSKQFKFDEPWDSENNKPLIEKMPKIYFGFRGKPAKYSTFYQSFSGEGAFIQKKPLKIVSVTDGLSNTLMVVESGTSVIWSKPEDITFDEKKELPKLGAMFKGDFNAAFGDGSVSYIKKGIDPKTLKALITVAGGEVVERP